MGTVQGPRGPLKDWWQSLLLISTAFGACDRWEPAAVEYWVEGAKLYRPVADDSAFPVLNFQRDNISAKVFSQLVREGRPFVVRALGESHPMQKWDCQFFQENPLFSKLQGRREYADANSSQPEWKALKDILRTSAAESSEHSQASLRKSPYYVGLKDALHDPRELAHDPLYSQTWSKDVLKLVRKHSAVPDFMPPGNLEMIHNTPEFWFVEAGGTSGAKAHVDAHAESTWSLQLCGQKRWRISPIAARKAPHVMKLYQDGQIYQRKEHLSWKLFEDVVLSPGDAIFFGPGFIHQTEGLGPSPGASVTWQFDQPMATSFLRSFMVRIRFTPDLLASWQQIQELVRRCETWSLAEIRGSPDLVDFLDVNGDGEVLPEEREEVLEMWSSVLEKVRSDVPQKLQKRELGLGEIVHDEQDLEQMPKKIQSAIRQWELKAFGLDEAVSHAEL
eukprot:s151_g43.t1